MSTPHSRLGPNASSIHGAPHGQHDPEPKNAATEDDRRVDSERTDPGSALAEYVQRWTNRKHAHCKNCEDCVWPSPREPPSADHRNRDRRQPRRNCSQSRDQDERPNPQAIRDADFHEEIGLAAGPGGSF